VEFTAIDVTYAELHEKLKRVKNGMTLTEVRQTFGGEEFKHESGDEGEVSFWRFRVLDAANTSDPHEIYMGTFADGKLSFGSILPRG